MSGPSGLRPSTRTGWPGFPTTVAFGGTSWITTEFAPTFAPWPTVIGPSSFAPEPIVTLSSTVGWRLPVAKPVPAERDALEQRDAVADLGGLADHDAGAVVDEEVPPDPGGGMDLDARSRCGSRSTSRRGTQRHVGRVQRVGDAVGEDRVHARIGEQDLDRADRARGRVAVAGGRDVLAQLARHACDRATAPSRERLRRRRGRQRAQGLGRRSAAPAAVAVACHFGGHERHAGRTGQRRHARRVARQSSTTSWPSRSRPRWPRRASTG